MRRAITAGSRVLSWLIDPFAESIELLNDARHRCESNIIDVAAVRCDHTQHDIRHRILTLFASFERNTDTAWAIARACCLWRDWCVLSRDVAVVAINASLVIGGFGNRCCWHRRSKREIMFVTRKDSEGRAHMAIAREATPLSYCLGTDRCGNYLAMRSQEVCKLVRRLFAWQVLLPVCSGIDVVTDVSWRGRDLLVGFVCWH